MNILKAIRSFISGSSILDQPSLVIQDEQGNNLTYEDLLSRKIDALHDIISKGENSLLEIAHKYDEDEQSLDLKIQACEQSLKKAHDEDIEFNISKLRQKKEQKLHKFLDQVNDINNKLEKAKSELKEISEQQDKIEEDDAVELLLKASKEQQEKVGKVMDEWKQGSLKSSSGDKVTSHKQAIAIALSEAGLKKKKSSKLGEDIDLVKEKDKEAKIKKAEDIEDLPRLDKSIVDRLNQQITNEFQSSFMYRATSAWLDDNGWIGGTALFSKYADEELDHAKKVYQYLFDKNCKAATPSNLGQVEVSYKDIKDVVSKSLEHEMKITSDWNDIASMSKNINDHDTYNLALKFVAEQTEEENKFRDILFKINLDMPKYEIDELFEDKVEKAGKIKKSEDFEINYNTPEYQDDLAKAMILVNEAINEGILDKEDMQLVKGRRAAEGEERTWGGKKYKKQNGKWIFVSSEKKEKKVDEKGVDKKNNFKSALSNYKFNDYELDKDNQIQAEFDIQASLGFPLGNQGYARFGDIGVRVKDHTPDWSNFNSDIEEDGLKKIINVTVGDFNNSDYRRNKTSFEEIKKEYPSIEFVNIELKEGDSVKEVVNKVMQHLKGNENLKKSEDGFFLTNPI